MSKLTTNSFQQMQKQIEFSTIYNLCFQNPLNCMKLMILIILNKQDLDYNKWSYEINVD
jgi:hypothetical protein